MKDAIEKQYLEFNKETEILEEGFRLYKSVYSVAKSRNYKPTSYMTNREWEIKAIELVSGNKWKIDLKEMQEIIEYNIELNKVEKAEPTESFISQLLISINSLMLVIFVPMCTEFFQDKISARVVEGIKFLEVLLYFGTFFIMLSIIYSIFSKRIKRKNKIEQTNYNEYLKKMLKFVKTYSQNEISKNY